MNLEEQISQITNPQEFTRLCNLVLTEEYGVDFQVIDGTRSDEGNDGYIVSEKRIVAMHCPIKPERKKDSDYVKKIRGDLKKAATLNASGRFEVERWTFLTPRKLSNNVIAVMRSEADVLKIHANHQEATYLASELQKNRHLIREFPELFQSDIDGKLDEILHLLKQKETAERLQESEIDSDHIYKGKANNDEELELVLKLRKELINNETKPRLRSIYYSTDDTVVKLNALLGILDFYEPADDSDEELVELCEEGILIAENNDKDWLRAYLLAQKGYFVSSIYSMLDIKSFAQIMTDNVIGFSTISEGSRQGIAKRLHNLEREYKESFNRAISIAKDTYNLQILAAILISLGNAAGQRATYLRKLSITDRAMLEKRTCRRALLAAKEIYVYLNDEHGRANALFNLANQIRFLGEEKEALALTENVIVVAKKYYDQRLLQRAKWLKHSLETGKIPDYMAGERRE